MIGGLGRAATSILRQLIDAGTLSNLPAGFQGARHARMRNSDEPLQPGEFRDIDAPGWQHPRRDHSPAVQRAIGHAWSSCSVHWSRAVGASSRWQTTKAQNMGQEQPVGTTVALLERGMKVLSAIHKRLHYGQKQEFRILARIISRTCRRCIRMSSRAKVSSSSSKTSTARDRRPPRQ
jgi:hypothetical protein